MENSREPVGVLLELVRVQQGCLTQHKCINFIPSISNNQIRTVIKKKKKLIIAEIKAINYFLFFPGFIEI